MCVSFYTLSCRLLDIVLHTTNPTTINRNGPRGRTEHPQGSTQQLPPPSLRLQPQHHLDHRDATTRIPVHRPVSIPIVATAPIAVHQRRLVDRQQGEVGLTTRFTPPPPPAPAPAPARSSWRRGTARWYSMCPFMSWSKDSIALFCSRSVVLLVMLMATCSVDMCQGPTLILLPIGTTAGEGGRRERRMLDIYAYNLK